MKMRSKIVILGKAAWQVFYRLAEVLYLKLDKRKESDPEN